MSKDFNFDDNPYTRDELLKLGIYELRELGRDVGVISPTTLKKEPLVDSILSVIYGETPKRNIGKGRGRPTRKTEKPSKLFVDLIESIEKPNCETSFIYRKHENEEDDYEDFFSDLSFGFTRGVASPKTDYLEEDKKENELETKKGVVSVDEDGKYFIKKYKFINSLDDVELKPYQIQENGLKDSDVVEYLLDDQKNLIQIIKVNGEFSTSVVKKENKIVNVVDNAEIYINDDISIKPNQSSLILVSESQERACLTDKISEQLVNSGYSLVKLCLDRVGHANESNNFDIEELYSSCIGDDYEALALVETAVERTKFLSEIKGKTALVIDNAGWLSAVLDTYPKALYGNFLDQLVNLPKVNTNITIVAMSSKTEEKDISKFDNVIR